MNRFSEFNQMEMARRGRLEVICGSMFSGKTEELIRRLKRAKFARQKVEIFKPALDTRYSDVEVVSHDSNHIISTPIESSASILLLATDVDVVGIDEAQFFDSELVDVCNELARRGTGKTMYILDEPTTGLHIADVHKLVNILDRFADSGNTVVVIEHNLDVIKVADHVIDLGPEGGDKGGYVVFEGTPEGCAECAESHTGRYLKPLLEK